MHFSTSMYVISTPDTIGGLVPVLFRGSLNLKCRPKCNNRKDKKAIRNQKFIEGSGLDLI